MEVNFITSVVNRKRPDVGLPESSGNIIKGRQLNKTVILMKPPASSGPAALTVFLLE
jgi:hypothetical protein